MGAEQRQAIRRALNEDAEKLLAEGDPADPQLRRLRREIDDVNRLFDEFERRARAEGERLVLGGLTLNCSCPWVVGTLTNLITGILKKLWNHAAELGLVPLKFLSFFRTTQGHPTPGTHFCLFNVFVYTKILVRHKIH